MEDIGDDLKKSLKRAFTILDSSDNCKMRIHDVSDALLEELKPDTDLIVASSGLSCRVLSVDNDILTVDREIYSHSSSGKLPYLLDGEILIING